MKRGILGKIFGPNFYNHPFLKKFSNPTYKNKFIHIDAWSITHLILFYIIGLLFPNRWTLVILGTLLFEVVEEFSSTKIRFLKELRVDTISEIWINLLGYWLAHKFPII